MAVQRARPQIGDFVLSPDNHLLQITEVAGPDHAWWFRARHPIGRVVLVSNTELIWDPAQQAWREPPVRHLTVAPRDGRVERRRTVRRNA